jgi:hypothetical protein
MKDARGHGSDKTNGISVINPNGGNIAPKSNFQKFWAGSATQSVANDIAAGRSKTVVAGGGQPMSSNAAAAQSLMSGLKSTQAPVHDSMGDHYRGLASWVSDYKSARAYGNVKLAKSLRGNIDAAVSKHGLDRARVYGGDPEKR